MREDEHAALKAAKRAAKLAANPAAAAKRAKKKGKRHRAEDDPASHGDAEAPAASSRESGTSRPTEEDAVDETADSHLVDEERWCTDCGASFTYSVAEQKFFLSKGWAEAGKRRCTECTRAKKARFGEVGGAAAARAAQTTCYSCGQRGHSSRDCPTKATLPCFNCGGVGHKSKDCPEPRKPAAGVCFKFQSGSCTRGEACRFAHVLQAAAS